MSCAGGCCPHRAGRRPLVGAAIDLGVPGWVSTRMGGPSASDDLEQGHLTQTWLATTDDPDALRSGQVWKHPRPTAVAATTQDATFQDRLLDQLAGRPHQPPAPRGGHSEFVTHPPVTRSDEALAARI